MKTFKLEFDVVGCESKVSARTGKEYFVVTAYVDLGAKYPLLVREFVFDKLNQGLYTVPCSLEISRNGDLVLSKDFSQAELVRG